MKLNKNICKKCINTRKTHSYDRQTWWIGSWTQWDDKMWFEDQQVGCTNKPHRETIPINQIPDDCPYKLEHLVLKEILE